MKRRDFLLKTTAAASVLGVATPFNAAGQTKPAPKPQKHTFKLKYGPQQQIFRTIPGLEKAEFARLGGLHRNTFLNSPKLLDGQLRLRAQPRLRFAGQMTGCEGYVESAASGLIAGRGRREGFFCASGAAFISGGRNLR